MKTGASDEPPQFVRRIALSNDGLNALDARFEIRQIALEVADPRVDFCIRQLDQGTDIAEVLLDLCPEGPDIRLQLADLGPQPSNLSPEPTNLTLHDVDLGSELADFGPQPSNLSPEPTNLTLHDVDLGSELADFGPQPSNLGPQPTDLAPHDIDFGSEFSDVRLDSCDAGFHFRAEQRVTLGDELNLRLEPFGGNPDVLFDLVDDLLVHAFLPTA